MKRKYEKPEMEIVDFNVETSLLSGSTQTITMEDDSGDGYAETNRRNDDGVWGDIW